MMIYQSIWVVAGPVYFAKDPAVWLGQSEEVKAAVPDATYRIVIRENAESETGVETLAFIFPNIIPKSKKDIAEFLTSIEDVEHVTGLTFGNYPRSFTFDSTRQFVYCCNQHSDNLAVFRVNRKTVGLKFTGPYTPVGNPSIIVFVDLTNTG
jgi:hypothetical protein